MQNKPVFIGITGGSGAGKTHIVKGLTAKLGSGNYTVITQDNYYKSLDQQPLDANGVHNFDTLESIDLPGMKADIAALLRGESIRQKIYTFNNPYVPETWIEIHPSRIVIVEGLFVLADSELRKMLDFTVYVEVPEYDRLRRRIKRDNIERGYDITDVVYRFEHHVFGAFKDHIEPFREQVDMLLMNTGEPHEPIDRLFEEIKTRFGF